MKSFLLLVLSSSFYLSINCSEDTEYQKDRLCAQKICAKKCDFLPKFYRLGYGEPFCRSGYIEPLPTGKELTQEEIADIDHNFERHLKLVKECQRKCFQKVAIAKKLLQALKDDNK